MSIKKNFFSIIALSLVLVSCGGQKAETVEEKEIVRTADLIENINQKEKEEKEKVEKEVTQKEEAEDEIVSTNNEKSKNEDESTAKDEEKEELSKVKIKAFGDIMSHLAQIQYANNKGGGSYDFSDSFAYVKDYVSDADISIGNYETTTNPNQQYSGFPRFNTPIEFIYAIKDAGFDILTTANNHSLDTDVEGLHSTIYAIDEVGLGHVGSQKVGEDKILYKNVNGIKLAFLAYTYGANGLVNLVEVREEVPELNYLHADQIKADINEAKSNGADFVVVYPHWGIEYHSEPSADQVELGRNMIEWGADLVIGNHPHVVEPYEYYETEDGRTGFIAYALGNFISFQNLENNNDIRTEQSVSYEIDLTKNKKNGATSIENIEAHPVWVGVNYNESGTSVQTYMAEDFLDGGKYYDQIDDYQRSRIQQAYDMTLSTIDQEN